MSQVSANETPPPPLYSGWLTKLGAVRKSWKRRWFVISPEYGMTYYAGTDTRGAPKGEMVLQGYEVRADCFKAEKDLCIELYHQRRRCFYVYADTVEEYEQWIQILKEVRAAALARAAGAPNVYPTSHPASPVLLIRSAGRLDIRSMQIHSGPERSKLRFRPSKK